MSNKPMTHQQIAKAFFSQPRAGTPDDIDTLAALLEMAEDHGAAVVEFACDVETVERTCPDIILEASAMGAVPSAAILERP